MQESSFSLTAGIYSFRSIVKNTISLLSFAFLFIGSIGDLAGEERDDIKKWIATALVNEPSYEIAAFDPRKLNERLPEVPEDPPSYKGCTPYSRFARLGCLNKCGNNEPLNCSSQKLSVAQFFITGPPTNELWRDIFGSIRISQEKYIINSRNCWYCKVAQQGR